MTLKTFFPWVLAIWLLLMASVAAKDSAVAGLLFLTAAVLSIPVTWRWLSPKIASSGKNARVTIFAGVGIGALAIAGMTAWTGSPRFRAEQAQRKAQELIAEKQARAAEAKQLAAAKSDEPPSESAPESGAEKSDSKSPYADEFKQIAWLSSSEEAKEKLKDPDSAEFRDVRFYSGAGVPVACGEVNAKNGFGGYNGFERFVALGPEGAFLDSEVSGGIAGVWGKFCVHGPDDKATAD
jgi:hypothetical protein